MGRLKDGRGKPGDMGKPDSVLKHMYSEGNMLALWRRVILRQWLDGKLENTDKETLVDTLGQLGVFDPEDIVKKAKSSNRKLATLDKEVPQCPQ